jgi:hypothetical protein
MERPFPVWWLVAGAACMFADQFLPQLIAVAASTLPSERMQIAISIALLWAALRVILSKAYGPTDKHWAYATIGTLLGYWLRT